VKRLVVLAVGGDEVVDLLRVERVHLGDEARTADGCGKDFLRDLATEHRSGGVFHRRDDHRARVDQRAIEVEEDDAKAHPSNRNARLLNGRCQALAPLVPGTCQARGAAQ